MNKRIFGRKLSRSRPSREALFASLARALIINGKIETTRAKAKAVQGDLEKLVTLAKSGEVRARRKAVSYLDNARDVADILFQKVAKAFASRASGYTRMVSLPPRVGDNAPMVRLEWTEKVEFEPKKKEKVLEEKSKVKIQKSKVQVKSKKVEKGKKKLK
jgi:large subunit ribosomal protein L17